MNKFTNTNELESAEKVKALTLKKIRGIRIEEAGAIARPYAAKRGGGAKFAASAAAAIVVTAIAFVYKGALGGAFKPATSGAAQDEPAIETVDDYILDDTGRAFIDGEWAIVKLRRTKAQTEYEPAIEAFITDADNVLGDMGYALIDGEWVRGREDELRKQFEYGYAETGNGSEYNVADCTYRAARKAGALADLLSEEISELGLEEVRNPYADAGLCRLDLNRYRADGGELVFDYTFTCEGIEDGFSRLFFRNFRLEITEADGKTSVWESSPRYDGLLPRYGEEKAPGAWVQPVSEPFDVVITDPVKSGENAYDFSFVVKFLNGAVPAGEKARVDVGGLSFIYNSENPGAPNVIVPIGYGFLYDIDLSRELIKPMVINYTAPSEEISGIIIKSVQAYAPPKEGLPAICRIEASIDYSKNTLADPNNINIVSERQYLPKLDIMSTGIYAVTEDGKTYNFKSAGYYFDESAASGRAECYFEIDSMYPEAPETLALLFTGLTTGTMVNIPLTLGK